MLEALNAAPGTTAFRHNGIVDRACLTVSYRLNMAEHDTRQSRGLGAVTDEFELVSLMSLPAEGLGPVSERFCRPLQSAAGRASNSAVVVEDPEGGFWGQRRLGVPLELLEIETTATTWKRGRDEAHRWVGYGPRVVRLPNQVNELEVAEASHYGIGLVNADGERILEPGPYRPQRFSSARWRLAELVYQQFLELNA